MSVLDHKCRISVTNSQGIIIFANPCFCSTCGYSLAELLGNNHRLLKSGVHSPEHYRTLWTSLQAGRSWHGELCNRRKDGTLYWVDTVITPVDTGAESGAHFLAMSLDVSERHRAYELMLSESKYALLGRIADGTAHDINNFLTLLLLGLDSAEELASENRDLLKKTIEGISALTQNMRGLARTTCTPHRPFKLVDAVRHAARLITLKFSAHRMVSLDLDLDAIEESQVMGNEGEIASVVLNLLINAFEALANTPTPRVRIIGRICGPDIQVEIIDNGPGLPESVLDGLFERAVSTKGEYRGQGLMTSMNVMRTHNAQLACKSSGEGTCFGMVFPAARA